MENTLNALEQEMQSVKEHIELNKSLQALLKNKHFKRVIMDNYLQKEAVRLTHMKGDPNWQEADKQEILDKELFAIGSFASYLRNIEQNAITAENALKYMEEERDRILSEE